MANSCAFQYEGCVFLLLFCVLPCWAGAIGLLALSGYNFSYLQRSAITKVIALVSVSLGSGSGKRLDVMRAWIPV